MKSLRSSLVLSSSILIVNNFKLTSLEGHLAMIVLTFCGFDLKLWDIEGSGSQKIFIHRSPLSFFSWNVELNHATWPALNSFLNFSSSMCSHGSLKVIVGS